MADDIVEIVSSDDDFEGSRRQIGWNYQGITKNVTPETLHGNRKQPVQKTQEDSEDDILIVELTPEKKAPSHDKEEKQKLGAKIKHHKTNGNQRNEKSSSSKKSSSDHHATVPKTKNSATHSLPVSSTRQEIKSILRNKTQSTISNFFSASTSDNKRKHSEEETSPKEKKKIKLTHLDDSESKKKKYSGSIASENLPSNTDKRNKYDKEASTKPVEEKLTTIDIESDDADCDDTTERSKNNVTAFIERWRKLKPTCDSNDLKIQDKIWKHYYMAHCSYTHSKKFMGNLEHATSRMTMDNIYVLIKDLMDDLKSYKDVPYKEPKHRDINSNDSEIAYEDMTKEERKKEKKLKKIEKMMQKISSKIQKLDEAEVDLDDEDNSSYLVQERLKAHFMRLDDFYCSLSKCSRATGRPVERKFKYSGSRYPEINSRITTWINKHREFPDYQDVLNLVKKVTADSLLPLRPETVRVQAQEIFRDVGKILKERRESDDLYSIYSYTVNDNPDPAIQDIKLAAQLNTNAEIAQEKLTKVFQKYVEKEAEMRETADKKAAIAEMNKTLTDDESTEKDSKDTSEPLTKDSDNNAAHDSDDTMHGDDDDLPKDCAEKSSDGVDDKDDQQSVDTKEIAKLSCDEKNSADETSHSPIEQEELVFDGENPQANSPEDSTNICNSPEIQQEELVFDDGKVDDGMEDDSEYFYGDEEEDAPISISDDASLPDIESSHLDDDDIESIPTDEDSEVEVKLQAKYHVKPSNKPINDVENQQKDHDEPCNKPIEDVEHQPKYDNASNIGCGVPTKVS